MNNAGSRQWLPEGDQCLGLTPTNRTEPPAAATADSSWPVSDAPDTRPRSRVSRNDALLEDSRRLGYSLAMAATVEQLAEQAMTLPMESRAQLADLLVESLDAEELGHIDRLWVTTAKHRRDEVRSGRVEAVPGEEALQKVRDALHR